MIRQRLCIAAHVREWGGLLQASKLGVEVPQMGDIAAALAALQWTARVAAALAALPEPKQGSPAPERPCSPQSLSPAAELPASDALMAEEALDGSPSPLPDLVPGREGLGAAADGPHEGAGGLDTSQGDGWGCTVPASACLRAGSRGACDCEAGSQPQQRLAPGEGDVVLGLADAAGLLEEGRALPVDKGLLEGLADAVGRAHQWEAGLVALIGPSKVGTGFLCSGTPERAWNASKPGSALDL